MQSGAILKISFDECYFYAIEFQELQCAPRVCRYHNLIDDCTKCY
jgi:hypothetical protein